MTGQSSFQTGRALSMLAVAVLVGSRCVTHVLADGSDNRRSRLEPPATAIAEFLQQFCLDCHSENHPSGSLRLDDLLPGLELAPQTEDDRDRWMRVQRKLRLAEMPPSKSRQPPQADVDTVLQVLSQLVSNGEANATPSSGATFSRTGNRLKHAALFSGKHQGPAFTPTRVWRISPQAYSQLMSALQVPSDTVPLPFQGAGRDGLRDFASLVSIDETATSQLVANAQVVVASQIGPVTSERLTPRSEPTTVVPEFARLLNKTQSPGRELLAKAVTKQFELIVQRRPGPEELERHVELLQRCIADAGMPNGVVVGLSSVLLLPEAVFRFEVGSAELDEFERRFLAPRELARAVAYALTDDRPDDELLRAAAENRLVSRSDVEREVKRLLGRGPADNPRLLRFFREYFEYSNAASVFKDKNLNVHHSAETLVSDTALLVEWVLERDQNVLAELLTTRKSFVNFRSDPDGRISKVTQLFVHTSYGLPHDWEWVVDQPIELPAGQRSGILTQPSWLVAHSSNFENQPIQRGRWIRERLLGGLVPDVPITVDARLPDEPHNTLRHRLRVTREKDCRHCHQLMNPLGLPFEQFDHFGRYRTDEPVSVKAIAGTEFSDDRKQTTRSIPINATGGITGASDSTLNRPVDGPLELLETLAKSKLVRQVFVRHAFRYFLGRNEMLSDSPTLIAADEAYVRSGGSFQALVTSLLTSDSFLYRRAESASPTAVVTSQGGRQ